MVGCCAVKSKLPLTKKSSDVALRRLLAILTSPGILKVWPPLMPPAWALHWATGWQPYAEQMMQVIGAETLVANTSDAADGIPTKPDYRRLTMFENRGLKLGHGVWDLVFQRV